MNKTETTYSIHQLSVTAGISKHALRYYEKAGLPHDIGRTENGYRVYSEDDLGWIRFLQQLRRTGMPIQGLLRFAELRRQGRPALPERRRLLERQRDQVLLGLQELQESLEAIERTIVRYRELEQTMEPPGSDSAIDGESCSSKNGEAHGNHGHAEPIMERDQPNIDNMDAYYALRSAHYESIYHRDDPVRQDELAAAEAALRHQLAGLHVLEVACGTGYWTERVAGWVRQITAFDLTPETLEIARRKPQLQVPTVRLMEGDAYRLDTKLLARTVRRELKRAWE